MRLEGAQQTRAQWVLPLKSPSVKPSLGLLHKRLHGVNKDERDISMVGRQVSLGQARRPERSSRANGVRVPPRRQNAAERNPYLRGAEARQEVTVDTAPAPPCNISHGNFENGRPPS